VNFGQAFFATNCVSCHSHNHSSFSTQSNVQKDASDIESRIKDGDMPEGATLTAAQISDVETWLKCGAP
jgi:mono/diheme cytochrome c family protein